MTRYFPPELFISSQHQTCKSTSLLTSNSKPSAHIITKTKHTIIRTPTSAKMSSKQAVFTDKAPPPLPMFSQAVTYGGMVYCSGSIGIDLDEQLVEGGVEARTVYLPPPLPSPLLLVRSLCLHVPCYPAPNSHQTGASPQEPHRGPHRRRFKHRQRG